jgi:hypothetical protein
MRANNKSTKILAATAGALVLVIAGSTVIKPFAGKGEDLDKIIQDRMASAQAKRGTSLTAARPKNSPEELLGGVSAAETQQPAGEEGQKRIKKVTVSPTPLLLNPSPRVTKVPPNSAATNTHWYDKEHAMNQPKTEKAGK